MLPKGLIKQQKLVKPVGVKELEFLWEVLHVEKLLND